MGGNSGRTVVRERKHENRSALRATVPPTVATGTSGRAALAGNRTGPGFASGVARGVNNPPNAAQPTRSLAAAIAGPTLS